MSLTGPKDVITLGPTRSLLRVDPEAGAEIDDDVLKGLVDENTWQSITRRVVDAKALALAIRTSVIAPGIVAEATVQKPAKVPYFRAVSHDDKAKDPAKDKARTRATGKRIRKISDK